MQTRSLLFVVLLAIGSLAAGCSKGGKEGKSGKDAKGPVAYDEEGKAKPCPPPETSCEDRKEPTLSFKDACSVGGYRLQLCGCEELCTGNVSGSRSGYDRKNKKKDCAPPKDSCPEGEESAAFQDACSEAGGQLMECGCDWLCSSKLKEALPDAAPAEEKKDDESKDGDKKDGDKSNKSDKKKSDKKSEKKKK